MPIATHIRKTLPSKKPPMKAMDRWWRTISQRAIARSAEGSPSILMA
jgi:hypothetical protein